MPLAERTLRLAARILMAVAALFAVLMALHVTADILSKLLLLDPIDGTSEVVANYYMVGIIFLPLAALQWSGGHIEAALFTAGLSPRAQQGLTLFSQLLMALVLGLLAWRSGLQAITSTGNAEFVPTASFFLYVWPARWLLPIGFGVAALAALAQGVASLAAPASAAGAAGGKA